MQKFGCVWTHNLDSFAIPCQVLEQLNWNDDGAENLPILGKLIAHDCPENFSHFNGKLGALPSSGLFSKDFWPVDD